jgi:hypothetical protein
MEAMWTYAIAAFLVAMLTDGGKPSFLGVCAVVFLSFGISRGLQNSELSLGVLRIWGTALSFLVFYAIVRVDFFGDWRFWDFSWANGIFNDTTSTVDSQVPAAFGIPILWVFWIRGILRGQVTTSFEDVVGSFALGVLIIACVELFQGSLGDAPAMVGKIAVPYVAFGLLAIGLAHSARAENDQGRPFSRTLLTTLGVSIAALAVGAAIVGLFDLATSAQATADAARAGAHAGETVGNVILWPVLKLMDGMFWVLIWLRDHILGTPNAQDPNQAGADTGPSCVQALMEQGKTAAEAAAKCNPQPKPLPDWLQAFVRLLVALPIVGGIVLLTAMLFARFRKKKLDTGVKESSYQEGRLASDLGSLLHNLVGRLRPNLHLGREHLDPIRKLYFEMIDDGERRGVKRRPFETPNEVAPALDGAFRGPAPGHVTSAFDDARYGGRAPPDADVKRLREEWERLRSQY